MKKKILITGATDGIGLETAKRLASEGQQLLIHGRNSEKLDTLQRELKAGNPALLIDTYVADLSLLSDVNAMLEKVMSEHQTLDVLLNNAGVYNLEDPQSAEGLDKRFVVNTISPYLLAKKLLQIIPKEGRIVNVASAAQAPFSPDILRTVSQSADGTVYAQSKLAMIMWSNALAASLNTDGPVIVCLNPKSLLGSKMVKEAFGIKGASLSLGADILVRAALSEEFADASGKYFDNDIEAFGMPHRDALNESLNLKVLDVIDQIVSGVDN